MLPVAVTSGTLSPTMLNANSGWGKLVDGQQTTVTSPVIGFYAATMATSTSPFMQLVLDAVYSDIFAVVLFPANDAVASLQASRNVSVVLSATSAFAASTTRCASNLASLVEMVPTFTLCPAASGIQYVTVTRAVTTAASFYLQEVMVLRSSGVWCLCSHNGCGQAQRVALRSAGRWVDCGHSPIPCPCVCVCVWRHTHIDACICMRACVGCACTCVG